MPLLRRRLLVGLERGDDEVGQLNRPVALFALRLLRSEDASPQLDQGVPHGQLFPLEVDRVPAESENLALPHASPERHGEERAQSLLPRGGNELLALLGGEELDFLRSRLCFRDLGGRLVRDEAET